VYSPAINIFSQLFGKRMFKQIKQIFLLILIAIVLIAPIIIIILNSAVSVTGPLLTSDSVLSQKTIQFFNILSFSLIPFLINGLSFAVFRSAGKMKIPLYLGIIVNIANIAGNILTHSLSGIAYSTVLSRYLCAALALFFIYKLFQKHRSKLFRFRFNRVFASPDLVGTKQSLAVSSITFYNPFTGTGKILKKFLYHIRHCFVSEFLSSIKNVFAPVFLAAVSTIAVASYSFISRIEWLALMFAWAIATTMGYFIAGNLKKKTIQKVSQIARSYLWIAIIISAGFVIFFSLMKSHILHLFVNNPDFTTSAQIIFTIIIIFLPVRFFMIVFDNLRLALGDTAYTAKSSIISYLLVMLPVIIFLKLSGAFTLESAIIALLLPDIVRCILSGVRFFKTRHHLISHKNPHLI
jgi:Na+-driven multidrug efflux pump